MICLQGVVEPQLALALRRKSECVQGQMDQDTLHQIEQILEHEFTDTSLLAKAFTHSSSVDNRLDSNERLEFLGDAVLSIVICQVLFEKFESTARAS